MKENFSDDLKYFEKRNKIKINIIADDSLVIPDFIITFENRSKKIIEKIEKIKKLKNLKDLEKENHIYDKDSSPKKIKFKRKKFYKKKYFKKTKLNPSLEKKI